mgnify:CR=1 FL=1
MPRFAANISTMFGELAFLDRFAAAAKAGFRAVEMQEPYDFPADLVVKLWQGRYRGQIQQWFLMQFKGTDSDVDIATEHQEFSNWQWLAVNQLADNIVPFKRPVYEKVLAAFAAHL